ASVHQLPRLTMAHPLNLKPLFALAALLFAGVVPAQDKPARPVPTLGREPKLDGAFGEFAGALVLKADHDKATAAFTVKVGFRKDTLFFAVDATDDKVTAGDLLLVSLHFPDAGATARGYGYRFALDGKRTPDPEGGAPLFANALVRLAVKQGPKGLLFEAAFPPRSLPRFPARDPLVLDLCLTYEDRDEVAENPVTVSNCTGGTMAGGSLKLPDELRKGLKLKPPESVDGLEAREGAWLGYAALSYPRWIAADAPLTPESLISFATDMAVDPTAARIPLPANMSLPGGRAIWPVLSGKDPYAVEGECNAEEELRLGLFAVKGKFADRVLEWPAATCALGRAVSLAFNEEGSLTIGYSNGSSSTFAWSTDHFERTELGLRE
ncbi:MAG: hypothetical protein ACYC8T_38190, partial [Myxococcaceae bacterium]